MKLNVFDTNMLTLFEEGHPVVLEHVHVSPPETLCTTIIAGKTPLHS